MKIEINSGDSMHELLAAKAAVDTLVKALEVPEELSTLEVTADVVEPPTPMTTLADASPTIGTEPPSTETAAVEVEDITQAEVNAGNLPELDQAGTPWDTRIHASSKATVKDGTWKKKRRVDDNTYQQVMAEITASAEPVTGPDTSGMGFGAGMPQSAATSTVTWPDVVNKVMTAKAQQTVTQEQLDREAQALGVEAGFGGMSQHPELLEQYLMVLGLS